MNRSAGSGFTIARVSWLLLGAAVLSISLYALIPSLPPGARVFIVIPMVLSGTWIVFLAFFLLLAIHELGHLAMGAALGLRFAAIQIGRFRWQRRKNRIHFSDAKWSWMDGYVHMLFPKGKEQRWRASLYLLGGSCANALLAGALILWVYRAQSPEQGERGTLVVATLIASAFTLAPLAPFRNGARFSDGAHLLGLLRNWPAYRRGLASSRLLHFVRDRSPGEPWDAEDLELAGNEPSDANNYPIAMICTYYRAFEAGDHECAKRSLETVLECATPNSAWYYLARVNAAIYFGFVEGEAIRAQDFLNSVSKDIFPGSYVYPMAVACTRYAQQRWADASSAVAEATELIELGSPDKAEPYEIEILERVRAASKERLGAAQP